MRVCGRAAHIRNLKGVHAHARMHISENFSAPIRTKIATLACVHTSARMHTKGLIKTYFTRNNVSTLDKL